MNSLIYSELLKLSNIQTDNFKKRAYSNAANAIKSIKIEIKTLSDINGVKGIGKSSKEKIAEILKNGSLNIECSMDIDNELNTIKSNNLVMKLSNIYGIGNKQAIKISKEINDFNDLYLKQDSLLNNKQKIGLKYYEDLLKRIPRNEIEIHKKIIFDEWKTTNIQLECEIVGSYRRNKNDSGDIDILVTFPKNSPKNFKILIESLIKKNYLIEHLAWGQKKYMGISKVGTNPARRIDILYCTKEEYPYCLLYFTGSGEYNRGMRDYLKKKGYKLNEKGLTDLNNPDNFNFIPKTEKDIFDFLNIKYLNPEDRLIFSDK